MRALAPMHDWAAAVAGVEPVPPEALLAGMRRPPHQAPFRSCPRTRCPLCASNIVTRLRGKFWRSLTTIEVSSW
jgi:hypothetical protein